MQISGINVELPKLSVERKEEAQKGSGFAETMSKAISEVNAMQVESNKSVEQMLTGDNRNIHETMVALEKADISLKLLSSVRNKALEAYNTIMRMQA